MYKGYKLFLSEDWFGVVRVDCDITSISSFRIDIPPFSKSIWFDATMTRMKSDDKTELREILGPLCLSPSQYLSSRKVPKIFIICNNINGIGIKITESGLSFFFIFFLILFSFQVIFHFYIFRTRGVRIRSDQSHQ